MPRRRDLDASSRARAVCVRCHSRKVRCDLEARPSGVCSRCEHEGCSCQLHIGPRKQKALRTSLAAPPITLASTNQTTPNAAQQGTPLSLNVLGNTISSCPRSHYESPQSHLSLGNGASEADLIMQITQAAHCPPTVISQALADFYFRELFHLLPVLDRDQDELGSSLLLQQSLYFAGSCMRRSTEGPPEWSTSAIYKRIKALISVDNDPAPSNILTSLCILSSWPMHMSHEVVLDNPWQWAGTAIRLALQLQMHVESTYAQFANPGRMRRIWWYLFSNDTLQMGCSGRPGMFPLSECNVPLPTVADFNNPTTEAHVFCELTSLCLKINEILQMGKSDNASQPEVFSRLNLLRVWRDGLPHELQLFDVTEDIRQPYHRAVSELHIFYLVTIILTCFLGRHENSPLLKCASIVASSCIARLYEEILYHEDVHYLLPIHAWANLVSSIPRTFSNHEQVPNQANDKRTSQMIMEKMSEKHPSVKLVQQRINEISHAGADAFDHPDTPSNAPYAAPAHTTETRRTILALFPFSSSFCPTLGMITPEDWSDTVEPDLFSDLLVDVNNWDWPVEWSSMLL